MSHAYFIDFGWLSFGDTFEQTNNIMFNWLFSSYNEDFFLNSTWHIEHIRGVIFATMCYINWHLHYITIRNVLLKNKNIKAGCTNVT